MFAYFGAHLSTYSALLLNIAKLYFSKHLTDMQGYMTLRYRNLEYVAVCVRRVQIVGMELLAVSTSSERE